MKAKIYKNTLILCILTIIISYIMKLFGYSGFEIPIIDNTINNNLILMIICYSLLYTLNSILIIIIIVKRKLNIKELIIVIVIFILLYISSLFINIGYFKFLIEIIILIIISCILNKDFKIIFETILIYGLMLLYQYISLKTKGLIISIAKETFTNSLILQIDFYMLILLALLYFTKKGVHLYELVIKTICKIRWRPLAFIRILSERKCEEKCLPQNKENIQEVKFEIGYFIFNLVLFIFQASLILTICYFIKNNLINVILIFISFTILRKVFGKSYHADTIIKCTTLSTIMFIVATELSFNINISILSSVFVGAFLAYLMHIYYYYYNYIKNNNDLTNLNLEQLKQKLYYLTELEINLIYDYWHKDKHITADEIAEKYGYNKMKIYRTIKKIKDNNL